MAALSFKYNIHLPNTCPTSSLSSHLPDPIILVPPNFSFSSTTVHFNRDISESSQPMFRRAKANSKEDNLTSQILGRIFNIPHSLTSHHSSRPSHLQLLKKSRKLLPSIHLGKNKLAKPTAIFRTRRKESASTSTACEKFDMSSGHSIVACVAVSSRPTTVVATSYDVDGQLRNNVIAGRKRSCSVDFPDEGVFVVYRNRALQIAAPPCDQRKCNISQLCRCHNPDLSTQGALLHHHADEKGAVRWPTWKPCSHCLFNWLHLYQATEAASKLNMKCLQHPRSLTLTTLHGQEAFYYDGEIEEQRIHSQDNGNIGRSTNHKLSCPPNIFEWMTDAWDEFADCCCCKSTSITALSDSESDISIEDCSGSEQGKSDNDWDWDDFDIPCKQTSASSISEVEDYDFIEDLVDKEFPKLRKNKSPRIDSKPQPKPKLYRPEMNDDDSNEEDDDPVPVIIPPKDMAVGRGLRTLTNPTSPTLIPATNGSSTTVTDARYTKSQSSFGTKRSYFDVVRSEQYDAESSEDLSRAKQRKLDFAVPKYGGRRRQGSMVHEPFSQNPLLRKLVPV
ncbi:uncharacterized protein GGS22DRAFT_31110 [Annulohypoxylon maeteangense]|uniref:uncharacterized protein n=1 Tax=Annulohypoxylon maeteangense TaxID=1927788 RepID=UPI002007382D|nr:uncharacterized protein GGS22DRAFT_31110 [Annulohypoxylon maeteangense]KAI0883460.1 hypothetical protein GGS22DRAFT_31110 [Annulohypoxylon maeteangense]